MLGRTGASHQEFVMKRGEYGGAALQPFRRVTTFVVFTSLKFHSLQCTCRPWFSCTVCNIGLSCE